MKSFKKSYFGHYLDTKEFEEKLHILELWGATCCLVVSEDMEEDSGVMDNPQVTPMDNNGVLMVRK